MDRWLFWAGALFLMGCGSVRAHFDDIWRDFDNLGERILFFHPQIFNTYENYGILPPSQQRKGRSSSVSLEAMDKPQITRSSSSPVFALEHGPSGHVQRDIHPKYFFDCGILKDLAGLSSRFLDRLKSEDLEDSGKSFFGFLKSMTYTTRRVMGLAPVGLMVSEWRINQSGISQYLEDEKRELVCDFLQRQIEKNAKALPFISLNPKHYQGQKEAFSVHVFEEGALKEVFGGKLFESVTSITQNLKEALAFYKQETEKDSEIEGDVGSAEEDVTNTEI